MPFNSLAFALLLGSNRLLLAFRRLPAFWFLLVGSFVFYLSAGIIDLGTITVSIVCNWFLRRLDNYPRLYLTLAILMNLVLLGFFKYRGFFGTENFIGGSFSDLILPLGISFYTFQMIAYHVDVVKKRTNPAPSFKSFVLFVGFYPQLVAGPIVRASQLLPQINRVISEGFCQKKFVIFGLGLILLGMAKKVIMADSLGPVVDDIFFIGPDSFGQAWLGAILFTFQIYFDFSGYSDIAVGAAYLLGFRIPFNFRTPYSSTGPAEFWQRWHMTLSAWIRIFVYIPLGGSRGSQLQVVTVLIVTMIIAGLWHGASFTFIVWGAAWGAYILVGRILQKLSVQIGPLQWFLHMSVVVVLWVFFRAVNLDVAFNYIAMMFNVGSGVGSVSVALWIGLGVISLFSLHWLESHLANQHVIWKLRKFNTRFNFALITGLIIGLLLLPNESQNPFIYFRF